MINISNEELSEDKYDRLRMIAWWDQSRIENTKVMVVGAGAIGNELIKNLTLLGFKNIYIVDMDEIETTNLTRSVLFRQSDVGQFKAEVAAKRANEINPDINASGIVGNILTDIGLGFFKRIDVVLGGLDNREARLGINQSCYKVNKPWIDGAIEVLNGFARVFVPGDGPCYECTMTETDWNLLNKRKSCALLSHEEMNQGKIPTTPTSSSVIAGIQVQELLKLIHRDRNLPILIGKGFVFNGLTHDSYTVQYQRKDDCMSHDTLENIEQMPWSSKDTTLKEVIDYIKQRLGERAQLIFDREIVINAKCECGSKRDIFKPLKKLKRENLICENCDELMDFESIHRINGTEDFLHKTLGDIGIPPLDILTGRMALDTIHLELSKDEGLFFEGRGK